MGHFGGRFRGVRGRGGGVRGQFCEKLAFRRPCRHGRPHVHRPGVPRPAHSGRHDARHIGPGRHCSPRHQMCSDITRHLMAIHPIQHRAWQILLATSSNVFLTTVCWIEWRPMTWRVIHARPCLHIPTAAQRYVVHAGVRYLVVMRHLQSLVTLLQRPLRRGLHSSTSQLNLSRV